MRAIGRTRTGTTCSRPTRARRRRASRYSTNARRGSTRPSGRARAWRRARAGVGQAYLGAYHDADGAWLDGGKQYTLHVPPNPPAKQFWSLTVYDTHTRGLVDNAQQVADKSSRTPDLARNADGSVDLYMGPTAPPGKEKNWIPTIPGKAWFAYFRLYAPTEAYLDASWKLPDIARVK